MKTQKQIAYIIDNKKEFLKIIRHFMQCENIFLNPILLLEFKITRQYPTISIFLKITFTYIINTFKLSDFHTNS